MPTITTYAQIRTISAGTVTCYPGWFWKGGTIRSGGVPSRCLPHADYNLRKFDLRLPDGAGATANDMLMIEYDPSPPTAWKPVVHVNVIPGIAQGISFSLFGVNLSTSLSATKPCLATCTDGSRKLVLPRMQYDLDVRLFGKLGVSLSAGNLKPPDPPANPAGDIEKPDAPAASDIMTARERVPANRASNGAEHEASRSG